MHKSITKFLKKLHHECQSRDTDIIFTYSDIVYMCIYRRQLKKVYRSTAYVLQNIAKQQPCTKLQNYHEQVYIRVLKIIIIKKPIHFLKFPIKIYIHIFAVLTSCNVWRRSQKNRFQSKAYDMLTFIFMYLNKSYSSNVHSRWQNLLSISTIHVP